MEGGEKFVSKMLAKTRVDMGYKNGIREANLCLG